MFPSMCHASVSSIYLFMMKHKKQIVIENHRILFDEANLSVVEVAYEAK